MSWLSVGQRIRQICCISSRFLQNKNAKTTNKIKSVLKIPPKYEASITEMLLSFLTNTMGFGVTGWEINEFEDGLVDKGSEPDDGGREVNVLISMDGKIFSALNMMLS